MDDDFLDALPTDTEAAIAYLHAHCPPAVRPRSLRVALVSQVYAVVADRTAVDQELEERRLSHAVRVLRLPSSREELIVVRADAYEAAMAADAAVAGGALRRALEAGSRALPACTGLTVRR
eukprot:2027329-Prymnesium_polylepis.1